MLDGGPIEEFAPVALREQQLDFIAQFGICPRQQRRPLVRSRFTRSMIELFNFAEPLRAHGGDTMTPMLPIQLARQPGLGQIPIAPDRPW